MESAQDAPALPADSFPSPPTEQQRPRRSKYLRELTETALLIAIIFLLVNAATSRFKIDGSSMEPNLHSGEFVIADKIAYLFGTPQRGDVVVFQRDTESKDYIKRVIGLPGETIEIAAGTVYIEGQPLDEVYIQRTTIGALTTRRLGVDEYFVMGDNRGDSSDSRHFGPIRADDIIGRAWIIYWPPADWAVVPHYTYAASESP